MAGENTSPTTAAAPVTNASAPPSAPASPTGGTNPTNTNLPSSAATSAGKGAKSSSSTAAAPSRQRVATPAGPQHTAHKTEADLDAMLADFDKGEGAPGTQTGNGETKGNATTGSAGAIKAAVKQPEGREREQDTELQAELDEANAAADAAGLTVVKPAAGSEQEATAEPSGDDPEQFMAWLETLPKGAKEKILRQQRQLRELKGQLPEQFVLTPTWESPLANVTSDKELTAHQQHHQTVAHECRRLLREGTFDGEATITLADGKRHAFKSIQEVEDALAWSEKTLDLVPDTRDRLRERARSEPWEKAEKLAPGMFAKGSFAHDRVVEVLRAAPQIKEAFPDWEVRLGHMARSMMMEEDAKPTTEFPHGKSKWVKLDLDAQGRVVMPKAKVAKVAVMNTKPVGEAARADSPSQNRPALTPTGKGPDGRQALADAEKNLRDEDALDVAIRAFEREGTTRAAA